MNKNDKTRILKAATVTLGCRTNQADSALICGRLKSYGYEICDIRKGVDPDIIILNTCAVTASASQKSRQTARSLKKKFPNVKLVATGCSCDTEKKSWEKEKCVDLLVPNIRKNEIPSLLTGESVKAPAESPTPENSFKEETTAFFPFRSRAFIKIQDGCNSFCTYCIVPYARGRERSRNYQEIISEFRSLLKAGHREIVLTGINISTYNDGGKKLYDLLAKLTDIPGDFRIRLGSTEPHPENLKLINLIGDNPKICRFIHLPLQHGANEILAAMGRNYKREEFAEFANRAAHEVPGIHIGTDVITGFPGETEKLFDNSCEFIKSLPLANLHIFRFSPREGTPAANFANQITQKTVKRRHEKLSLIEDELAEKFISSQIGKNLEVIIEKKKTSGEIEGWSDNYIRIAIQNSTELQRNMLVKVKTMTKCGKNILKGELL